MDEEVLEVQEELAPAEMPEVPIQEAETPAGGREELLRREIEGFLELFPDVKGEDIPAQVWAGLDRGMGLSQAYALYENRMLREELDAMRQNSENSRRSLGSLGSSQAARSGSSIEEFWDAAES